MKKSLKLYESELKALSELPVEISGKVLYALVCNEIGGIELPELSSVETVLYSLILEQTKRAREAASKMKSRRSDEENVHNISENVMPTPTRTLTRTPTTTEYPPLSPRKRGEKKTVTPTEDGSDSTPKINYAEFVRMTSEEHEKLVDKLGEHGVARCIEILDNYKGQNKKTYKSDYRAILNWVIRRYEEDLDRERDREQKRKSSKGETTMEVLARMHESAEEKERRQQNDAEESIGIGGHHGFGIPECGEIQGEFFSD